MGQFEISPELKKDIDKSGHGTGRVRNQRFFRHRFGWTAPSANCTGRRRCWSAARGLGDTISQARWTFPARVADGCGEGAPTYGLVLISWIVAGRERFQNPPGHIPRSNVECLSESVCGRGWSPASRVLRDTGLRSCRGSDHILRATANRARCCEALSGCQCESESLRKTPGRTGSAAYSMTIKCSSGTPAATGAGLLDRERCDRRASP